MSIKSDISQEEVGLLRAARAGNLEKVKNYLNQNVDINVANSNGLNALHLSAKEGYTEVVTELINHKADVNSKTKKGNGPLHIACLAGQTHVAKLLLEHEAQVNSKAQNGFTPLYMAAQENHIETVKLLIGNGANLNALTEDGFTALDVAVQQGHKDVVVALLRSEKRKDLSPLHDAARKDLTKPIKFLLQNGYKVDAKAPNGFTPLHIAAKYNSTNAAALLINSGANIDALSKTYAITPLHAASKFGHANIVSLLLQSGAKPDKPNRDGLTSLHCASREGHTAVVESLFSYNSNISAKTKNGLTPLHLAVQGNHSDTIVILVDNGAPLNAVAVDGLCPIHIAAHYGHVEATEALLGKGVDTDSRARNGFTPLHIACKKNREPVIHLLLKYGANINAVNEGGQTPMHVSAYYSNVSVVLMLLQNGGSPDVTNMRGETVLHIACRIRNITIVRLLLRNGAAVDAKTQSRETALHIAVKLKNIEMVKLLLDHGASCENVDRNKCTPLHLAARNGDDEIVKVLFEHKPPLLELNLKGFTPLHEAVRHGHVKTVGLLLHAYPSPDPKGKHGMTPLHVASHYDHVKVALQLINKDAEKYAATKNGFTPLHIASTRNQIEVASILLEHGVEPDTTTKSGISPLHLAAKEGHVQAASILLDHGANPSIKTNNGLTPLHVCARYNQVEVAKVLLKYRAEINAQTSSGFTPLHIACHCGNYEIAKLLLENEAGVEVTTQQGYMPLHFAAQQGHGKIIELLLTYHAPPDAVTKDGFTALYIAQYLSQTITTIEWKYILEMLVKVTTNQVTVTVLERNKTGEDGEEVPQPVQAIELPEELEDDTGEETVTLEDDTEEEILSPVMTDEEYLQSFMTNEVGGIRDSHTPVHADRSPRGSTPDSSYHEVFRDLSTPLSAYRPDEERPPSHLFEEDVVVVSESFVEATVVSPSFTFEESDLDKLPTDNISRGPPVSGGFLISFMVDARGCEMRSSETGIKMSVPAQSCPMPTRITCRLLRSLKASMMPTQDEGEARACRVIDLAPAGVKFLKPVTLEVPHFASLRNGERELVILSTYDGGNNWKKMAVESASDQEDVRIDTQYVRVSLNEFPTKLAIISRLKKDVFVTGNKGELIKSHVNPQCTVNIPEGAVKPGTMVELQVLPVDEHFNNDQEGAAISTIVKISPSDLAFSRPVTVSFPTPTYTRRHEYEASPVQRLLNCPPGTADASSWNDITSSTPLKVINGCATFTTEEPGRYCLVDTFNDTDVCKDAKLIYRKLSCVPYMAKFVVFAKLSADGQASNMRVFCMTDDKVDKTLETQTGFTEVACSRNIEICDGQAIFLHCTGNMAAVTDQTLQFNFFAFRENRLPFNVHVVDSNEPMKMKLAVILNPRRDHHGRVHAACALDINLSGDVGRDTGVQGIPDKLVELIAKQLGEDWISFGQVTGQDDSTLQEILDSNDGDTEASARKVITLWKENDENDASMEKLESHLKTINREDILGDFKRLAYSSYGERIIVTEIRRPSAEGAVNGVVNGDDNLLNDPLSEMTVEEKRYSGYIDHEAESSDPAPERSDQQSGEMNGSSAEKDDVIKGMFSDNQEILEFFRDNESKDNEETEID